MPSLCKGAMMHEPTRGNMVSHAVSGRQGRHVGSGRTVPPLKTASKAPPFPPCHVYPTAEVSTAEKLQPPTIARLYSSHIRQYNGDTSSTAV